MQSRRNIASADEEEVNVALPVELFFLKDFVKR
jgi:hypothetical protein